MHLSYSFNPALRKLLISLKKLKNKDLLRLQKVMAAKLTRLTQKLVIWWHLTVESCTTCCFLFWHWFWKLLVMPVY